jgi:hypothetical protein
MPLIDRDLGLPVHAPPGINPEADHIALIVRADPASRKLRGKRPPEDRAKAKAAVDAAKRSLGERGPVWWTDGSPDYNRRMARNTPYADWYERLANRIVDD